MPDSILDQLPPRVATALRGASLTPYRVNVLGTDLYVFYKERSDAEQAAEILHLLSYQSSVQHDPKKRGG